MTPIGMPPNLHKQNKWNHTWLIKSYKCFNSPCYIGTLIRTMGQGYTWLFHIQQSLPIRPRFPQMNHCQRNHLAKHLCCLQRNTSCQQLPINEANFPLASYIKLILTSSPWMDVTIPCTAFVWLTWCQSRQKFDSSNKACRLSHRNQAFFFFIDIIHQIDVATECTYTDDPYKAIQGIHARCRSHRNKALFCLLRGSYRSLISEKCIPGSGAPQMKCRGSYGDFGGTNSTSLSIGSLIVITGRGPFLHYRKQTRKMLDKNSFENILQCKKETHC